MGWTVQNSNLRNGKKFFSSPETCRLALGPTQSHVEWVLGFFPGVKQQGPEVDHSPLSSAEVKYEWNSSCTPSICLHGMDRDMLPFCLYIQI